MHVAFASIWCLAFALVGIHTTLVTELLELVLGTNRGYNQLSCLQRDGWKIRKKEKLEKVYFRSQILECPSIGENWNISGEPVLPENLHSF